MRVECRDGKAEEAERPAGLGEVGRSQSPHNTAIRPMAVERGGKQNRAEGRGAGSWRCEVWSEATEAGRRLVRKKSLKALKSLPSRKRGTR